MNERSFIDRALLKEIVLEQKSLFVEYDTGVPRLQLNQTLKTLEIGLVTIITGIRRCGKSTLLAQVAQHVGFAHVHYLNFEDERLVSFDVSQFNLLLEIFYELNDDKQAIFLFDEIQVIPGWERFIRRLHDQKNKIIITGSNANLLSQELGTKLTGRHIDIPLFPFDFLEYLQFKEHDFTTDDILHTKKRAHLQKFFDNYLTDGGMPSYLKSQDRAVLSSVYEDILYRDIFQRYRIHDTRLFRELSLYLLSNITSSVSYTQLKEYFHIGSTNTVINYINHLENSYLLFTVNAFSPSYKKQINTPKKIYALCNSFIDKLGFHLSDNIGVLLENLVFIKLYKTYQNVFYYRTQNNLEVDFLVYNNPKQAQLIQVTHSLSNPRTRERELKALNTAMDELQLTSGLILTTSETETISKNITVLPVYQWLLCSI
jgi:predicted AAA+ superfamily ATPase